jgi:hypothetical protein
VEAAGAAAGEAPDDDDNDGFDEFEGPLPGRQRLLDVFTRLGEQHIDAFEAMGAGRQSSTHAESATADDNGGGAGGGAGAGGGGGGGSAEESVDWTDELARAQASGDFNPASITKDLSKDPRMMFFTWWVGTLWLFMYDHGDGLLGPREEVFEFKKGTGWWTVPMPELHGVDPVEADAAAHASQAPGGGGNGHGDGGGDDGDRDGDGDGPADRPAKPPPRPQLTPRLLALLIRLTKPGWGLYKFNPVDPQLETTWFQTLEPMK